MNINEAALCLVCLLNVPSHQDGAGLGGTSSKATWPCHLEVTRQFSSLGKSLGGQGAFHHCEQLQGGIPAPGQSGRHDCVLSDPPLSLLTVSCFLLVNLETGVMNATQSRGAWVQYCLDRCGSTPALPCSALFLGLGAPLGGF